VGQGDTTSRTFEDFKQEGKQWDLSFIFYPDTITIKVDQDMIDFSKISARFSADSFFGRLLRLPFKFLPSETTFRILQGPLRGFQWMVRSGPHHYWLGTYEPLVLHKFIELVKPGYAVIDIGANAGYYTLLASKLTGEHGRVFAFEPNPQNLPILERHLALNRLRISKNVKIFEVAVAAKCDSAYFDARYGAIAGRLSDAGDYLVSTVSLDDLFEHGDIPKIQVIKMDVEGGELIALEGARTLLQCCKPTILLGTHGQDIHARCCKLLEELGYRIEMIEIVDTKRYLCNVLAIWQDAAAKSEPQQ
jgi:FkbM family methyltransferase